MSAARPSCCGVKLPIVRDEAEMKGYGGANCSRVNEKENENEPWNTALLLDAKHKNTDSGNCRKSPDELAPENDAPGTLKDGELEMNCGQDDIGDSKESSAIKDENEPEDKVSDVKDTVITAIADAAAVLHKEAIDGAIDDISRENKAGRDFIDPTFLEKQRYIVADSLSEELAVFNIKINKQSVTLCLMKHGIKLLFAKGREICVAFSFSFQIKAAEKGSDTPQFILKFANGKYITCDTVNGDVSTRDKIVITAKAFLLKAILLAVPRPAWTKPSEGCIKLNTEVHACSGKELGAYGGLIRNHLGNWVDGFWGQVEMKAYGPLGILILQLEALNKGLFLANQIRRGRMVIVELYTLFIKQLLEGVHEVSTEPVCSLVRDCRGCLEEIGNYEVRLIELRANNAATRLAFSAYKLDQKFVVSAYDPPEIIMETLQEERDPPPYQLPLRSGSNVWDAEKAYGIDGRATQSRWARNGCMDAS